MFAPCKSLLGIKKLPPRFLSRICAANKRQKSHQSRQGGPCSRDDAQTARIFARRQVTPLCREELYQKGIPFVNGEKHKNGQLSKAARVLSFPAPLPPRLNPRLYLPRIGHIEDRYGKKELQPYPWAMMSQLAFAGLNIIFGRCGKIVVFPKRIAGKACNYNGCCIAVSCNKRKPRFADR